MPCYYRGVLTYATQLLIVSNIHGSLEDSVCGEGNEMNTIDENKRVVDSGKASESSAVIRYKGTDQLRQMIDNGDYIGAFVHIQLGVEKILWDRIERTLKKPIPDKSRIHTYELITWAHFMGLINDTEFSKLIDFNKKRNEVIHGHGVWWYAQEQKYRSALRKVVRFLEDNEL